MCELFPDMVLLLRLCSNTLLNDLPVRPMQATETHKNEKTIFLLSILSLLYFGFLLLNAEYFKFESIALGIVGELLTIPVIIGQFILLYFAWKKFKLRGYSIKTYAFASMIIVIGLIGFVLVSFLRR